MLPLGRPFLRALALWAGLVLASTLPADRIAVAQASAPAAVPLTTEAAARSKISQELQPLVASPAAAPPGATWARLRDGRVMVKVLLVAASADSTLAGLRREVLARGGSVHYNFLSVRALSAVVPASSLVALAQRSDVLQISPNRATQRQVNLLRDAVGAGTAAGTGGAAGGLDGRGIGIAILDSGIDFRHRHFLGPDGNTRVRASVDVVSLGRSVLGDSWRSGSDDSDGIRRSVDGTQFRHLDRANLANTPVPDPYGHGTAVASVAAGAGGYQSPDASGLAPGADLYDVRVLDERGVGTLADLLLGIDWVLQRARMANIRVLNMSLGASSTDSAFVDPLARAARSAVANGLVVVASAGNYGKDAEGVENYGVISSPGHEPSVITVGAANLRGTADRSDDSVTTFSSRGPTRGRVQLSPGVGWVDNLIKPDLVAPGNAMLAAMATDRQALPAGWNLLARTYPQIAAVPGASQAPRQTLMTLSGTSMSAPVVAGAAAVLLQANPGLTPPLVKAILQYTATPLAQGDLLQQGAGSVNLDGAVRLARALRPDIADGIATRRLLPGAGLLAPGATLPAPVSTVAGRALPWSRIVTVGGTRIVRGEALFTQLQPIWDPGLLWMRHFVLRTSVSYLPATRFVPADRIPFAFVELNAGPQPVLTAGVRLLDATALTIGESDLVLFTPLTTLLQRADAGMGLTLSSGLGYLGQSLVADGFVLSQGFLLTSRGVPGAALQWTAGSVPVAGYSLLGGFILPDGFVLDLARRPSGGIILNEALGPRRGIILNEGIGPRRGIILNEGFGPRRGIILNEGFTLPESFIAAEGTGDPAARVDRSFLGE